MGFLKKLFGGGARTPLERLAEARRLLDDEEPGLARLELEGLLADPMITAAERPQAEMLLATASERLVRARLDAALGLIEAGELGEAAEALHTAAALEPSGPQGAELAAARDLLAQARAGQAAGARARREAAGAADAEGDEVDGDADGEGQAADAEAGADEGGEEPEGDDEMTPLDLALLTLREDEADRLRALAAIDEALADALGRAARMDHAGAASRFREVREPAASDPLVGREHARAELLGGDPARARALLEPVRHALKQDVAVAELVVESRLAAGDAAGAREAALELLAHALPHGELDGFAALLAAERPDAARALESVDEQLRTRGRNVRLWELRGALLAALGESEDAAASDDRALALFRGHPSGPFPLTSARRRAQALAGEDGKPGDPGRARALLELLAERDPEERERWVELLRRPLPGKSSRDDDPA